MTAHALFLTLLFLGPAIAQDSAPISLSGKEHPPICRGNDSDAPGCITAPHATYSPDPKYPKKESKARHQGTVILDLVIDADGSPRDIKVSRPLSPEFDEAALDAVKKWKFSRQPKTANPSQPKSR